MDLFLDYINRNHDYKGFFKCKNIGNTIYVNIVDYNNIEYLYYNFVKDIYYFLRTKKILDTLNIPQKDINISKNNLSISNGNTVLLQVKINLF